MLVAELIVYLDVLFATNTAITWYQDVRQHHSCDMVSHNWSIIIINHLDCAIIGFGHTLGVGLCNHITLSGNVCRYHPCSREDGGQSKTKRKQTMKDFHMKTKIYTWKILQELVSSSPTGCLHNHCHTLPIMTESIINDMKISNCFGYSSVTWTILQSSYTWWMCQHSHNVCRHDWLPVGGCM